MVFKWGAYKYNADANEVGAEIEKIEAENGEITSTNIVERAKDRNSAMHNLFEWNNKVAGQKYREYQAKQILHSLVIVSEDKEPTRAFVNIELGNAPKQTGRYVCIEKAIDDRDMRHNILENAYRELKAFERKYSNLTELSGLFKEIDKLTAGFETDAEVA